MSSRIRVHSAIRARFPGFRARFLIATGVHNTTSTDESLQLLRAGAQRGLALLGGRPPRECPSIGNWRDVYSAFGAKPSAYPCSAESLIQRAMKGGIDALPTINLLVDLYNAISLAHLLPIGGEDLDQVSGVCELRFATSEDSLAAGADPAQAPALGEVIWADEVSWTCRRWNWRQGSRTRLTEGTRNAYFLIEGMASDSFEPDIDNATTELAELIQTHCNPARLEVFALAAASP